MQNVIDVTPQLRKVFNWHTVSFIVVFHLLAIVSLFTLSWANVLALLITWWISGSWGVGLGYHRLLTHRGFQAPRWLTRTLAFCGSLALQSGPIAWVTTHRIHHAHTDMPGDPHSPRQGTYWSHMGWIVRSNAQVHPPATLERYSPDLIKDRFLVVLDKYYYVPTIALAGILFLIGGWTMVFSGVFLRVVMLWQFTWLVNSATHLWGTRRFETRDDSRNNGFIAALTFGEGWHNNHHAYPRSARHGLTWREFDVNWVQIKVLESLGLVRNVYAYELAEAEEKTELRQAA